MLGIIITARDKSFAQGFEVSSVVRFFVIILGGAVNSGDCEIAKLVFNNDIRGLYMNCTIGVSYMVFNFTSNYSSSTSVSCSIGIHYVINTITRDSYITPSSKMSF